MLWLLLREQSHPVQFRLMNERNLEKKVEELEWASGGSFS